MDWVSDRFVQDTGGLSRRARSLEEQGGGPEFHILVAVGDREGLSTLTALARTLGQSSAQSLVTLLCITPDGTRPPCND